MIEHRNNADAADSAFSGADIAKDLIDASAVSKRKYNFLKHDYADRCEFESSAELRARYVRYTEKLISEVKNMADPAAQADLDGVKDTGVSMVFLDKSARPTYWLMDELWDLYAPEYKKPDIKFANIDREQWQDQTGQMNADTGENDVDVTRLDQSVFEAMRRTYRGQTDPSKSVFDGRKVLVVDETKTTGTTLEIATQMFAKAFPEAKEVTGTHWMVRPRGDKRTSEVPVWYNHETSLGRGVDDRNIERSLRSNNRTQREGAAFLSVRTETPDHIADGIRQEIHSIREDMLDGTMRFSVAYTADDEISPELLAAVTPWRERQKQENKKTS